MQHLEPERNCGRQVSRAVEGTLAESAGIEQRHSEMLDVSAAYVWFAALGLISMARTKPGYDQSMAAIRDKSAVFQAAGREQPAQTQRSHSPAQEHNCCVASCSLPWRHKHVQDMFLVALSDSFPPGFCPEAAGPGAVCYST